jgi:DnaJ-class molecular chaperone
MISRRTVSLTTLFAMCFAVMASFAVGGCADKGKIVEVDGHRVLVEKIECPKCEGEKRIGKNPCTKCFGKPELKTSCEYCNGRGKLVNTTNGDSIACAECAGGGFKMAKCEACEGTGQQACPECGAKGWVYKETILED